MLIHKNNSDTLIIVLHEIYGINEHIINVCKKLSKRKYDIIAPNLLHDKLVFSYDKEEFAYHYFMNTIGFEIAIQQIKQIFYNMRPHYKKIYVLGYSIGATLAWLCSQSGLCDLVVGFYGSRIRDHLLVVPQCPTLLFFPAEEKSFNVDDLIVSVSNLDKIKVIKLHGKHGFADPFSKNYNKESSLAASIETLSFEKSAVRQ